MAGAFTIVSVGRAVEKKGYSDLLHALAALRDDRAGASSMPAAARLSKRLKAEAERLGIADRITWHGAQDRAFIFDLLKRADLFVLPSRLTRSGDRDGLPNVLMEAQAFAVPVLATDVSGIPELVTHGKTGWLVQGARPGGARGSDPADDGRAGAAAEPRRSRREERARALLLRARHRPVAREAQRLAGAAEGA